MHTTQKNLTRAVTPILSKASSSHLVNVSVCLQITDERRFGAPEPDSEDGYGFVTSLNHGDGAYNARWVVGNCGEKNVHQQHI